MQTIIRQASIDDKNAIWDFIKVAYKDFARYKIPERWNWEYLNNHILDSKSKELPIFVAIRDGHIAGQICAILFQIKIGEELHHIAGGVDLVVLPICRGEGVGQKLVQTIAEHYKLYMAISMSDITWRIYDRCGYNKIKAIPTYRRLAKVSRASVTRFLIRKTKNHLWLKTIANMGIRVGCDKVISVILGIFIKVRDYFNRPTKKQCRSEIREVERFGDEIDQLWNRTSHKFKVIVKRDQRYLNWRFSDNNQLDYRNFICIRDGETKGYIVLRRPDPIEEDIGIIVDLYADPEDYETIEILISHAIDFFSKDVTVIECATSQKEYQKILSQKGFIKMEKTVPIFYCMDSRLRNKLAEWNDSWFLTKADHDWDQLWPK
jgi:GNAT superfamily N-acetyltransferase